MVPDTIGCMASEQQVQVPPRYARVNAWVISRDTDAEVRFLTAAFGAVETPRSRILDPDGDIGHVEVEIGDSVIMLFDAKPGWPPTRLTCVSTSMTLPRPWSRPSRPVRGW